MSLALRTTPPSELARLEDRVSFLYLEHATIAREDNALTATDDQGTSYVPSAALLVLMLGPGTRVTHAAMSVIADGGCCVVWVGESGVRYYAGGRPAGRSTRLLEQQARLVSSRASRLAVAREMYRLRFPGEDVATATMRQLRGREGVRIRRLYAEWSRRTSVPWRGRSYDPEAFEDADPINQALSAAHACLYGVVHGVVVGLGCAPGLGFVHSGHDRSFIFDVADLYKAEVTIPVAFEVVRDWGFGDASMSRGDDLASVVRRAVRDRIRELGLIRRIVRDLFRLLDPDGAEPDVGAVVGDADTVRLWDEDRGSVAAGVSYPADDIGALWSPDGAQSVRPDDGREA
ncbi:CRISPR-associated endonuclease Cas1 [Pseudoclavibacter triregionum]|nr:CRISPR-associated endonuclease Cas1 [Pseudoclavibacter triregionum]